MNGRGGGGAMISAKRAPSVTGEVPLQDGGIDGGADLIVGPAEFMYGLVDPDVLITAPGRLSGAMRRQRRQECECEPIFRVGDASPGIDRRLSSALQRNFAAQLHRLFCGVMQNLSLAGIS